MSTQVQRAFQATVFLLLSTTSTNLISDDTISIDKQGVTTQGNNRLTAEKLGAIEPLGKEPGIAVVNPEESYQRDHQLGYLLISSAWCSFSLKTGSRYSGHHWERSLNSRIVFYPYGDYFMVLHSEAISSAGGYTGRSSGSAAFTGRRSHRAAGHWMIQNRQYFMSEGSGPLLQVRLEVNTSAHGYPILKLKDIEYIPCP